MAMAASLFLAAIALNGKSMRGYQHHCKTVTYRLSKSQAVQRLVLKAFRSLGRQRGRSIVVQCHRPYAFAVAKEEISEEKPMKRVTYR
jgi:hypothetical protein